MISQLYIIFFKCYIVLKGTKVVIERDSATEEYHCPCGYRERLSKNFKAHLLSNDSHWNLNSSADVEGYSAPVADTGFLDHDDHLDVVQTLNAGVGHLDPVVPLDEGLPPSPWTRIAEPPPSQSADTNAVDHNTYLHSIGFLFEPSLKVLLCVDCEHAVIPANIPGHLRHHKIAIKKIEENLNKVVRDLGISNTPQLPPMPVIQPAIAGLRVYDGLQCAHCNYACRADNTAERHTHDSLPRQFNKCKVQTVFWPTFVSYFAVTVPEVTLSPSDRFGFFERQIYPSIPQLSIGAPSTVREIPPLLKKTLWHIHLKDWIEDTEKRHALKDLVHFISRQEPWTEKLADVAEMYLQNARNLALASHYAVLRRILSDNSTTYVLLCHMTLLSDCCI